MLRCDICNAPLHSKSGVMAKLYEFFGRKEIQFIVVLDSDTNKSYFSTVCSKDKQWVEDNPVPAEAIYRVRMRDD